MGKQLIPWESYRARRGIDPLKMLVARGMPTYDELADQLYTSGVAAPLLPQYNEWQRKLGILPVPKADTTGSQAAKEAKPKSKPKSATPQKKSKPRNKVETKGAQDKLAAGKNTRSSSAKSLEEAGVKKQGVWQKIASETIPDERHATSSENDGTKKKPKKDEK